MHQKNQTKPKQKKQKEQIIKLRSDIQVSVCWNGCFLSVNGKKLLRMILPSIAIKGETINFAWAQSSAGMVCEPDPSH